MTERRDAWLELRLLCQRGVGIATIAPQICRLVRKIVPADSAAVCWLDDDLQPAGFFHENSLPEIEDLFANGYQELFAGPGEFGVAWMLAQKQKTIGNWLDVIGDVEMSNTYNLWMRPLGHRHMCEIRVEADGKPRAIFNFYREPHWPFTDEDVAKYALVEPLLQRAATPDQRIIWTGEDLVEEHLVLDMSGQTLLSASSGAQSLLQDAHFIGRGISLVSQLNKPPEFITGLCQAVTPNRTGLVEIAALGGLLSVKAKILTGIIGPNAHQQILVTLSLTRPKSVIVTQSIMALRLSPLRSELLQFAVTGGRRNQAASHFSISKEALKKHLGEIYRATGASEWDELASVMTRQSSLHA